MIVIFQDAVATLDKYNLLPNKMNVKQAQSLVTKGLLNPNDSYLRKYMQSKTLDQDAYDNMFCLTIGTTDVTFFFGGPLIIDIYYLSRLNNGANPLLCFLATIAGIVGDIFPVTLAHLVCIGERQGRPIIPANGWVTTVGLKGVKSWKGSIYGTFNDLGLLLGIIGFTGIHLNNPLGKDFYLGSSLLVRIAEL